MYDFKIDDVLYHKTNKTRGVVISVSGDYIKLNFEKSIDENEVNEEKDFNMKSIGEWLFYSRDHIDLPIEKLRALNEYPHIMNIIEETKKPRCRMSTIQEVIEARRIINLVHFTRIENLESILTKGFIPRDILEKDNIRFLQNDPTRLDKKTNCTCFSVEFPNSYVFKKFRNENPGSKWAIILVESKILLEEDRDIYYCYHNAARTDIREQLNIGNLRNLRDFQNLFREKEHYNRSEARGTTYRQDLGNIKEYIPTSVQAEILISGVIPGSYINSVIFANQEDLDHFNGLVLNNIKDKKNISNKLKVNYNYFLNREQVNFRERGV